MAEGAAQLANGLNAVFNIALFWDGRAGDLSEQAKGSIQAGVEMNNTPERVRDTLNSIPDYVDAFAATFPGETEAVSFDNMAGATEAFEATLITPTAASTSSSRVTTTSCRRRRRTACSSSSPPAAPAATTA